MTNLQLFAKAVAFNASRDNRLLANLTHNQIETVLGMVSDLRDGKRQNEILAEHARPSRRLSPMQADRLRREFWADQQAATR